MTKTNLFRSATAALALLAGVGVATQVCARENHRADRPEKIEKVDKAQKAEKLDKMATADKAQHDKNGTEKNHAKDGRDKGTETEQQHNETKVKVRADKRSGD